MASGRMLKNKISTSEQIAELADRAGVKGILIYTWVLPHLDIDGKFSGNPRAIKGQVFPLIDDISKDDIAKSFLHAYDLGLVDWYVEGITAVIKYTGFAKNQNLRADREGASNLPDNISGTSPQTLIDSGRGTTPGVTPGLLAEGSGLREVKLSKEKVSKDNVADAQLSILDKEEKGTVRNSIVEDILSVYSRYLHHHPRSAKTIDSKSKSYKLIAARLKEGRTAQDLTDAIDGNHKDPYCKENGYHKLTLILRDDDHVTQYIEANGNSTSLTVPLVPEYAQSAYDDIDAVFIEVLGIESEPMRKDADELLSVASVERIGERLRLIYSEICTDPQKMRTLHDRLMEDLKNADAA